MQNPTVPEGSLALGVGELSPELQDDYGRFAVALFLHSGNWELLAEGFRTEAEADETFETVQSHLGCLQYLINQLPEEAALRACREHVQDILLRAKAARAHLN